MANIAQAQASLGAVNGLRVADIYSSVKTAVLAWNDSRVTRKLLSGLTDAQLDDIGLARADIKNF